MASARGVVRSIGGALALPVSAALDGLHQLATGRRALVDVEVGALPDAGARQGWLRRFRGMAADPGVAAVLLRIDAVPGSWAACQDLRAAIEALRAAGKGVHALLDAPGNAALWLASACDRVFVVPMGEVGLVGVAAELLFYGAALERLGVRPDFEAAGAYKSFGEPFTRTFASPANQEAVRALVDDLHAQLVAGIAAGRGLSEEQLQALLGAAPLSAEAAREAGLVDHVMYPDEAEAWLLEHHGEGAHRISFRGWALRDAARAWVDGWGDGRPSVTVLHLDGAIVMDDEGSGTLIRARKVAPILEGLRKDDAVAAVVLHVNSPGGSALASDLLWREVDLLAKKKPVIAVFEDVAASGGYYLSAPAAEILARPGTLTGSIGVFGGKLVLGEGLRKLGVHTQEISAAPNATLFSAAHPFDDGQRARFKASLQRFYDGFVDRVARGRHVEPAVVEPHCRGRVWTGRAAHARGLVDAEGDLLAGVERARELAHLPPGGFRRRDLSSASRGLRARLEGLVRRRLPFGATLELIAGTTGLIARHQAQALALLPFDLTLR